MQEAFSNWSAPDHFLKITTLDCHTGGEPLRIITGGFPELQGSTVLDMRRYCKDHYDHLRTTLMFEPRGHADMYGVIITPPERETSHFGAIFIHNEGYSTMCGHAVIALAKVAVEAGIIPSTGETTEVRIDAPCGEIIAWARQDETGQVTETTFDCVPSFVALKDASVHLEGLGEVRFDLAYGGAFYAYVSAPDVGIRCEPQYHDEIISLGKRIKRAIIEQYDIQHPFEDDLSFLYGTIFVEPTSEEGLHSRNVCVFAEGEVDRSPTGSGVSGRAALHFLNREIELKENIEIASILGSRFTVSADRETQYGPYNAVIPRVTGTAHISGRHEFLVDPEDPLKDGFLFR